MDQRSIPRGPRYTCSPGGICAQYRPTRLVGSVFVCCYSGVFTAFLWTLVSSCATRPGGTYGVYGILATLNFIGYLLGILCLPLVLARIRRRLALNTAASLAMNGAILASASSLTLWQLGI
jgi:hypothetical protein